MSVLHSAQIKPHSDHNPEMEPNRYYSVEFAISGHDILYQFKLWNDASNALFVLIKEESALIEQLKPGNVFTGKYYSNDSHNPIEFWKTEVRSISKDKKGRFKGHYLVDLGIVTEDQ